MAHPVGSLASHFLQTIRKYYHTGTYRRCHAFRPQLISGRKDGAAWFVAAHAAAWSEPHSKFLHGCCDLGEQAAVAVRELVKCDQHAWVDDVGNEIARWDWERNGAGHHIWKVMEPMQIESTLRSEEGAALVDAVAAAVRSGRAGSEEEQERVITASKKVPGRGDYLSAHLYRAMMRVLGQQIESDELAVMGGTGKKEGWDAARKALGRTKGGVVELDNVTALNQALGVAADWGDYAYFFCTHMYEAPMPLDSLANQPRGHMAWIQQLIAELNRQH